MALLVREPNARVVTWTMRNIYLTPHFLHDARMREVLTYVMTSHHEPTVVSEALEQLRSLAMRDIQSPLSTRLETARVEGDTAIIRALTPVEDRAVTLMRGLVLPTFLRRSPPVFTKRVTGPTYARSRSAISAPVAMDR